MNNNKIFINIIDESVTLNGNFAVKSAEIELFHVTFFFKLI